MRNILNKRKELITNVLGVISIIIILCLGFYFEIIDSELPCPLCLLQRAGFVGIGLGFLLNVIVGLRSSHYAVSLLSALFTASVAIRQILLHIVPGTGNYGSAILGFHMYTWSFIFAAMVLISISLILLCGNQYDVKEKVKLKSKFMRRFLSTSLIILTLANAITTYSLCGFSECPSEPSRGKLTFNL